jgi:hypothetical protein
MRHVICVVLREVVFILSSETGVLLPQVKGKMCFSPCMVIHLFICLFFVNLLQDVEIVSSIQSMYVEFVSI